jgi:hypothetical protein
MRQVRRDRLRTEGHAVTPEEVERRRLNAIRHREWIESCRRMDSLYHRPPRNPPLGDPYCDACGGVCSTEQNERGDR